MANMIAATGGSQAPVGSVGIIGGDGRMGAVFAKVFAEFVPEVQCTKTCWTSSNSSSSDGKITKRVDEHQQALENRRVLESAELVIFAVPLSATVKTIERLAPFVREDQILLDLTSLKVQPCNAMAQTKAQTVIGGHPMFGPSTALRDQNFVLCPVRIDGNEETTGTNSKSFACQDDHPLSVSLVDQSKSSSSCTEKEPRGSSPRAKRQKLESAKPMQSVAQTRSDHDAAAGRTGKAPTTQKPRGDDRGARALDWLKNVVFKDCRLLQTTPERHDKITAVTQSLVHLTSLCFVDTLQKADISLAEMYQFATPVFRAQMLSVGRNCGMQPELFAGLQNENPEYGQVLAVFRQSVLELSGAGEKHRGGQVVTASPRVIEEKLQCALKFLGPGRDGLSSLLSQVTPLLATASTTVVAHETRQ
ncbi:unnamed protein product [Amoebophrya sp. A120]|nr:unnamed protein product [Amoebophrya sp. A120]|eukprot:GSA120T00017367001.1